MDSAEDIGLLFNDNVNQNLLQWTMKEKNFVNIIMNIPIKIYDIHTDIPGIYSHVYVIN